ncbi:MAG TPA: nitrilase-related carbon-nitrogen hydrolase, partial [Longimicrobiales bacterium]|nr:nitrilase-related carbon-nitrogen hydrolase [Longimicrobiales bacterium]
LERMLAAARAADADVVLTPELSLTGYDLGDEAAHLALRLDPGSAPELAALGVPASVVRELAALPGTLLLGMVERGPGGTPRNAMAALRAGRVSFLHRKLYLPTYGMFDEGRFFGAGERLERLALPGGWRAGCLVCEDLWHPALPYIHAAAGAELLLIQAAAPGRGVWAGPEEGGRFASWDAWVRIARTTAQLLGIYVALCNRVGVEGPITFAGGSLVVAPDGEVVAAAGAGPETLRVELRADEVARARRPYAHARDEDPRLVLRELARAVGEAP